MSLKKKFLVTGAGLVLAGTVATAAFAAWSANGKGNGASKSKARQELTIAAGTPTDQLYPGASADVVVVISNPNPYPIQITSISSDSATAGNGITSNDPNCTEANNAISYLGAWNNGGALTLPSDAGTAVVIAKQSSYTMTLTDAIGMSNDSVDACSNVTFTVPVKAEAKSAAGFGTATTSGTFAVSQP